MAKMSCIAAVTALLVLSSCSQGPKDHMAHARTQLIDISRDYFQKDHPDWARQLDCCIIVVERRDCWEVRFDLPAENRDQTAIVRIAKGTMRPMGTFHE